MSAKMAQFDVFVNPVVGARRAYPFVVALQSDFAQSEPDQIVAPLIRSESMPKVVSRLTPRVSLDGTEHLVLVPALTGMRSSDLSKHYCSVASSRSELLGAIDYLFFGV
jgi:toxin CcdB